MNFSVSKQQFDAVLAGLRLLQTCLENRLVLSNDGGISDILTDGGIHKGLSSTEIDTLCESLNTANDVMPSAVIQMNGGAIYCAHATVPMRIVLLDGDIEGSDRERVMNVNGDVNYVHDFPLAAEASDGQSGLDPAFVCHVLGELDAEEARQ